VDKIEDQRSVEVPDELSKYEEILSRYLWVIALILIITDVVIRYIYKDVLFFRKVFYIQSISFFMILCINIFRIFQLRGHQVKLGLLFSILKFLDILLIIILLNTMFNGLVFSFLLVLPIVSICIGRGIKSSALYLIYAFVAYIGVWNIAYLNRVQPGILYNTHWVFCLHSAVLFFIFLVFLRLLENYNVKFKQNEYDNNNLVSQLGRKYAQLEEARLERQEQYDKLVKINAQLEETNKKLNCSLAEFFTLQQVSQAISSLFDMNELLGFVNDIIIGVMGASTSNIILYSGNRLKVQVSSIQNINERAMLTDNINNSFLMDAIDKGKLIIDNDVNPENYEFIKGRNVKSMLCVPLQTKETKHGLILIEHNIPGAFSASNIRLLEIITQQVSIAIDNAMLYKKLQDYANTDGLTQLYNRLYFQKRLDEELERAKKEGYDISVVLYDIDNFKKFNDKYGHLFGDVVLKSIAGLVKNSVRNNDIVARFGGEEFIIMLPYTSAEAAYEKAEELRKKISDLIIRDRDVSTSVTVSMGISSFPEFADTEALLLRSADAALYQAKGKGKNCVVLAGA